MTDLGATLAANVRALRESAGISLSQLAERSGVAKATLFKVERQHTNPTLDTMVAIADALGVTTTALLEQPADNELEIVRAGEGVDISDFASKGQILKSMVVGSVLVEIHHQVFSPGMAETSASHGPLAREHVFVRSGSIEVGPIGSAGVLKPGDYATYPADRTHRWTVVGQRKAEVWIVHTFARGQRDVPQ
ncbi:helix-turn-helix domain-containing protein [Angustibacter luteus]|uniref:XRE family transcriptional regulator n=1 Tax=Angustibacter luteus TaxID=658456 RepID=A0ABW1JDV1_9ACTN